MNPLYTLIARAVLSVIFCVFYGWIVLEILGRKDAFAPGVQEVLTFLLGALTTSVVRVISFWFDSSQGSAEKTIALARSVEREDPN